MTRYYGNKRGLVVMNDDAYVSDNDKLKDKIFTFGRVKIYVEGVYPPEYKNAPEMLPWAEPVMGIFGGNGDTEIQKEYDKKNNETHFAINKTYTNNYTGINSVPHVGAWVWVFFEDGNPAYPFYFGAIQAGNNWFAKHNNQHVIATDNVLIKIDENPAHIDTDMLYDSNNKNSTTAGKFNFNQKSKMPTRVNIEITNIKPEGITNRTNVDTDIYKNKTDKDFCAVNLVINGNVNLLLNGHMYEEQYGDRFITHEGNLYYKHIGDTEIEHVGKTVETHIGEFDLVRQGNVADTIVGDIDTTIDGGQNVVITKNHSINVGGSTSRTANGNINDVAQIINHDQGGANMKVNDKPYQLKTTYKERIKNPNDYTDSNKIWDDAYGAE